MIKVMLHKPHGADSLGFSLKQRWHNGQLGFFVNTITSGGVAYVSKQLRVGDRLVQVWNLKKLYKTVLEKNV